jgi:hypothetical protein
MTHGERMYICKVPSCGKKFLDNSKLKRHQLVHTVSSHLMNCYREKNLTNAINVGNASPWISTLELILEHIQEKSHTFVLFLIAQKGLLSPQI